ncbi:Conserved_hypothetical protein [Hexamita inflata]|uniref:Leucine-rich repeat protein n=1 Tax=Hexamita inflata TaxID=28002 RepID=A0ABP1J4N5_9EUKA
MNCNELEHITDIQYMTNLTYIDLGDNCIENINPLKNLTKLSFVNIFSNRIIDIWPLKKLINLEVLYVHTNYLCEVNVFKYLHSLKSLCMIDNNVIDVKVLENNNLNELYLKNNCLKSTKSILKCYKYIKLKRSGEQSEQLRQKKPNKQFYKFVRLQQSISLSNDCNQNLQVHIKQLKNCLKLFKQKVNELIKHDLTQNQICLTNHVWRLFQQIQ